MERARVGVCFCYLVCKLDKIKKINKFEFEVGRILYIYKRGEGQNKYILQLNKTTGIWRNSPYASTAALEENKKKRPGKKKIRWWWKAFEMGFLLFLFSKERHWEKRERFHIYDGASINIKRRRRRRAENVWPFPLLFSRRPFIQVLAVWV